MLVKDTAKGDELTILDLRVDVFKSWCKDHTTETETDLETGSEIKVYRRKIPNKS